MKGGELDGIGARKGWIDFNASNVRWKLRTCTAKRDGCMVIFQCKSWKIGTRTAKRDGCMVIVQCKRWEIRICTAKRDKSFVSFQVHGMGYGWNTGRKGINGFQYFNVRAGK